MDYNVLTCTGRAGHDGSIRMVNDQFAVSTNLAVSEPFKNAQGEWQDRVIWHQVTYWTRSQADADKMAKRMAKGNRLIVNGRPFCETFQRKDGTYSSAIKIIASSILVVQTAKQATEQPATEEAKPAVEPFAPVTEQPIGDDLPF